MTGKEEKVGNSLSTFKPFTLHPIEESKKDSKSMELNTMGKNLIKKGRVLGTTDEYYLGFRPLVQIVIIHTI